MGETQTFIQKLQLRPAAKSWVLFAILVGLFIPQWLHLYRNINNSIAPDLLSRTIGSRLKEAGKPVYKYKWKVGEPVVFLNPYHDTGIELDGVVSTPFTLWLFQPLAKLSYCNIRIIWSCIQEVLLFGTMWFCCCSFRKLFSQMIFLIIAALFFVYDRNWLLNLYNGQMYVVYAFIFAVSGYLVTRSEKRTVIALYPLMSLVRPFFITAIIPFFRFKKQHLLYFASSIAIAVLISAAATTPGEWRQYNTAMKMYAKEQAEKPTMNTILPGAYWQYADECTKTQGNFNTFGAGCLYSLQHYLFLIGISISNPLIFEVILGLSFFLVLLVAYKKDWLNNLPKQLLLSFLFYQLCELIAPAVRNPYSMVQWLPAIAWIIAYGNKQLIWIILTGLCLNHDIPFWFKYGKEIGEVILFVALLILLFKKNEIIAGYTS